MNKLFIAVIFIASAAAHSAETYIINGKAGLTKRDAVVALAKDSKAEVFRVQSVELSDKATIKVKK